MTASSTEASTTILLTFGSLSPLCDQFVHQRHAGLQIFAGAFLSAFYASFHSRDAEFVVFHAQDDCVTGMDAERFTKSGGDYYPSVLVDLEPGLLVHNASWLT